MQGEFLTSAETGIATIAAIFGTGLAAFLSYFFKRSHGEAESQPAVLIADRDSIERLVKALECISEFIEQDCRERHDERVIRQALEKRGIKE